MMWGPLWRYCEYTNPNGSIRDAFLMMAECKRLQHPNVAFVGDYYHWWEQWSHQIEENGYEK